MSGAAEPVTTIPIVPSWTAILPILLASRRSLEHRLRGGPCDNQAGGWCRVHDAAYEHDEPAAGAPCAVAAEATPGDLARARAALRGDLAVSDAAFADMARAADAYARLTADGDSRR